jgi:hypothetical protein
LKSHDVVCVVTGCDYGSDFDQNLVRTIATRYNAFIVTDFKADSEADFVSLSDSRGLVKLRGFEN